MIEHHVKEESGVDEVNMVRLDSILVLGCVEPREF